MGLILVVSEDAVEIETVKAALSIHGWWVTVASDWQSALQVAADQAPKLVVVDSGISESIELVKSFGTASGGPGVLAFAPENVEASLSLREAGADEMLTQPLEASRLLEAVQRCLSVPRQQSVDRAPASADLLTTEEIFGDVLRELEEENGVGAAPAPTAAAAFPPPAEPIANPPATAPAPSASPAPPAPPAPAASPAPAAPVIPAAPPAAASPPESVTPAAASASPPVPVAPPEPMTPVASASTPALAAPIMPTPPEVPQPAASEAPDAAALGPSDKPVVSLADLFDGEPIGDIPQAAVAPPKQSETLSEAAPDAEDLDSLWGSDGERGAKGGPAARPVGERRGSDRPWTAPAEEVAPAVVEPQETSPEAQAPTPPDQPLDAEVPAAGLEPAFDSAAETETEAATGLRVGRRALVIGSLAAALLVAVGVVFLWNPGTGDSVAPVEPAQPQAPAAEDFVGEDPAEVPEAPLEQTAEAEPAELSSASEPAPVDPAVEGVDLQAIVDQELERREEELRQVFLEEEKRLLRELGTLAPEAAAGAAEEDDGGAPGNDG